MGEINQREFEKLKKQIAEKEEIFEFTVVTDSMTPLIKVGDKIRVEKLSGLPRRFDILVFYQSRVLICHYFWYLNTITNPGEPALFTTRQLKETGCEDLPFPQDQVLGIVTNFRITFWQKMKIVLTELLTRILRRGIFN